MESCVMDYIKGRKVITCKTPCGFLHCDYPEDNDCYIKFEEIIVKMLCDIFPSYKGNITHTRDDRRKFICGNLVKGVYRTIMGAILFFKTLSDKLKK